MPWTKAVATNLHANSWKNIFYNKIFRRSCFSTWRRFRRSALTPARSIRFTTKYTAKSERSGRGAWLSTTKWWPAWRRKTTRRSETVVVPRGEERWSSLIEHLHHVCCLGQRPCACECFRWQFLSGGIHHRSTGEGMKHGNGGAEAGGRMQWDGRWSGCRQGRKMNGENCTEPSRCIGSTWEALWNMRCSLRGKMIHIFGVFWKRKKRLAMVEKGKKILRMLFPISQKNYRKLLQILVKEDANICQNCRHLKENTSADSNVSNKK